MYRTIQLSSCVSVQGELVRILGNGEILIRDGETLYRGRPVELPDRLASTPVMPGPVNSGSPRPN